MKYENKEAFEKANMFGTGSANTTCSSEPATIVLAQPASTPLPPSSTSQTSVTFRVCI